MKELDYLELLAERYPDIPTVTSKIIKLKSVLNLPKGTEHFLTDLHGEYEAFQHMLRTASGILKIKIDEIFAGELSEADQQELASLIFYPKAKLARLENQGVISDEWYQESLVKIIRICRLVASKYSWQKVRQYLPEDFDYIIEELLHNKSEQDNKEDYYKQIIKIVIETEQAEEFIVSLAYLIQKLVIDRLHILGDIFDRGPNPHKIIEELQEHPNCDIQWGNHDILWMGAGLGQKSLVATAVRISLRYGNLELLEEGYGINMRPLARFASSVYQADNCKAYRPKLVTDSLKEEDKQLMAQMQKAIAIIQFKLEGKLIRRRPEFKMNQKLYLEKINYEAGTITLNNQSYELTDTEFPTIDPDNPYRLTTKEQEIIEQLSYSFKNNDKLQEQIRFLFNKGSLYLRCNGNLLFHGCIPLQETGEFAAIEVAGEKYKGKELFDFFDEIVRKSYSYQFSDTTDYRDWLWYLWRGELSPLFGKDKMTTFCRYFLTNKELQIEEKNPYYQLRSQESIDEKILQEFGLNPKNGHIINGHTPVKEKRGESPIKGKGKLLVIDGGFSAAYQPKTGIAGYTLVYNSNGLLIISHKPFVSPQKAVEEGSDVVSAIRVVKKSNQEKIADIDQGRKLRQKISNLQDLLTAYQQGLIKEKLNS